MPAAGFYKKAQTLGSQHSTFRKRTLSLLLALCLLLGLLPVTAMAEDVQPTQAGLYCRWVAWDDNEAPFISDDEPYQSSLDMEFSYGYDYVFYYTDAAGNTTQLTFDELTFPEGIVEAESRAASDFSYVYLEASALGEGAITYTKDDQTYPLPVTVSLPNIGFFSAPEASEESYLRNGVTGSYGTTETVYFLWPEGFYNGNLKVSLVIFREQSRQQLLEDADLRDAAVQQTLRRAGIDIQEIDPEKRYIKMEVTVKNTGAHLIISSNGGFGTDIYTDRPAHETTSFQYKGNDYLFCMGEPEGDRLGFGDNSWRVGTGFTRGEGAVGVRDGFFALVQNYRADDQQEAPAACYRWISDVSFEMVGVHDPDDPENEPTTQLEEMPPHRIPRLPAARRPHDRH